jgi:hypothetical protein
MLGLSPPARHRRLGAGWHEHVGLCGQIGKEGDATGYGVRNVPKEATELCRPLLARWPALFTAFMIGKGLATSSRP